MNRDVSLNLPELTNSVLKNSHLALFAFLLIIASGCGNQSSDNTQDDPTLSPTEVVRQNADALSAGNVKKAMETIHPNSPNYKKTKSTVENLLGSYDIEFDVENLETVKSSDTEVKIRFKQVTRAQDNLAFQDKRVTGFHVLKKYKDQWKIMKTETESTEILTE